MSTNIAAALLAAQKNIRGVAKDSANSFHKYQYTSADDMIAACRDALHSAGLTVRRSKWWLSTDEAGNFRSVSSQKRTDQKAGEITEDQVMLLCCEFVVTHGESGESQSDCVHWPVVPERGRPLDKAMAGSLTSSFGYWLRDLLALPRGDHDEMDRRDDRNVEPAQARRSPRPRTEAPSAAQPQQAADTSDLMTTHLRLCVNAVRSKVQDITEEQAERAVFAALKAHGGHAAMLASAAGYGEAVKLLKRVKDWAALVASVVAPQQAATAPKEAGNGVDL